MYITVTRYLIFCVCGCHTSRLLQVQSDLLCIQLITYTQSHKAEFWIPLLTKLMKDTATILASAQA
jgi:hypothetical protein